MSLFADIFHELWYIYIPVLTVSVIIWSWISRVWLSPLAKIPGPPYGPLYGNVKEAARGEAMETSVGWVKKFGGIVRYYHFFGRERLLVADPQSVKHVLVTNSKNYPRVDTGIVGRLFPGGLLSAEGDVHRFQKKLMTPSFSYAAIKYHLDVFKRKADELTEKMLSYANKCNGEVNIQQLLRATTLDVISQAAFGYDIRALADPESEVRHAMNDVVTDQQFGLLQSVPFYHRLPLAQNRKLWRSRRLVDDIIYSMIAKKMEASERASLLSEDSEHGGRKDLLDLLMQAKDADTGATYTVEQLHDHVMTFIVAGHETTSISTTWLLLELARHPQLQERVACEVKAIFPTKASQDSATLEDYDKLSYLTCCIKESLRLYPPASNVVRVAARDDVISGFTVPAGTTVVAHLGAMMRTCWPDGEQFIPDRFLDPTSDANAWLPFALGPHMCIGSKFAMVEMKVLLVSLLQKLRFAINPERKYQRKNILLMVPHPEVQLEVSLRTDDSALQ